MNFAKELQESKTKNSANSLPDQSEYVSLLCHKHTSRLKLELLFGGLKRVLVARLLNNGCLQRDLHSHEVSSQLLELDGGLFGDFLKMLRGSFFRWQLLNEEGPFG
ncbi:Uncharacterized protein Fot_34134 [Forsythia ovata]|uniref:Uncharacterized protein n=1 Tax=Forsythia ovata TaxID=205694 RepID=A0ABD1SHR9_9LAMI